MPTFGREPSDLFGDEPELIALDQLINLYERHSLFFPDTVNVAVP